MAEGQGNVLRPISGQAVIIKLAVFGALNSLTIISNGTLSPSGIFATSPMLKRD